MKTQWNFVSFRGDRPSTDEGREERGEEPLHKSWVIAAWLEEGPGVIQSLTLHGALSCTFYTSQKESLGEQVKEEPVVLGHSALGYPLVKQGFLCPLRQQQECIRGGWMDAQRDWHEFCQLSGPGSEVTMG